MGNKLIVPSYKISILLHCTIAFSLFVTTDSRGLKDLICYECRENPLDNRLKCSVLEDNNILEDFDNLGDGSEPSRQKLLESLWKSDNSEEDSSILFEDYFFPTPCKMVVDKLLKLVESGDETLLSLDLGVKGFPIGFGIQGKDKDTHYEELKSRVSTIQFTKRENSLWIAVELQFRDSSDDVFSVILPDFEMDFKIIPNNIFYTIL